MVTPLEVAADLEWRVRLREERAHQSLTDALDSILRTAEALNHPFLYSRIRAEVDDIRRLCERSIRPTHS
jgi:hypothetical protein